MIPAALLGHVAAIWRATETKGATFRETVRTWAIVRDQGEIGLRVEVVTERREDAGAGERVRGEWKAFGNEMDVREGDVIQLLEGVEAPKTLLVEGVWRPAGHHVEMRLRDWSGVLE